MEAGTQKDSGEKRGDRMDINEIRNEIRNKGSFCNCPQIWSDETEEAIRELVSIGEIRVATKSEMPMNTNYVYFPVR